MHSFGGSSLPRYTCMAGRLRSSLTGLLLAAWRSCRRSIPI